MGRTSESTDLLFPRREAALPGVGHNVPQEAPAAFAQAIMDVDRY
jgi:pimeloyl-ACP methyl ester carboxylesterase